MNRPLLLDLYCGAGGAAVGYRRAGFEVIGVDIEEYVGAQLLEHLTKNGT